ncbi:unnamed protein product [Effrenium voratum]|uniref:Uncharacterized protein n=1 Tax=Effrenium voratum TaxID=2562239 RepID=A0AA36MG56_9DINO|nr:unnamed protein product [Effrenium voratum]
MEFQMAVPDGCCPGETIYMDLREGGGYTANSLSSKQKSNSRPPSAVRKLVKEELVAPEEKDETITASPSVPAEILEITIPEDCHPGDSFIIEVNDVELELTVPAGCQPGEVIYMDLLPEGTLTNSRPASATTADDKLNSRPASAKKTSVVSEQVQIAPLPRGIPEHQLDMNQPARLTKTLEAMGWTKEIQQLKQEVAHLKSVQIAPLPRAIPEHQLDMNQPARLTKTLEAMGWTKEIQQLKQEVAHLKSVQIAPLPRAIPEHQLDINQPARLTKTLEAMGWTKEIQQLKQEVAHLKSGVSAAAPDAPAPAAPGRALRAAGLRQLAGAAGNPSPGAAGQPPGQGRCRP